MNVKIGEDLLDVESYLFIGRDNSAQANNQVFVSVCPNTSLTEAFDLYATLGKQLLDGYLFSAKNMPDNNLSEEELKLKLSELFNTYAESALEHFMLGHGINENINNIGND